MLLGNTREIPTHAQSGGSFSIQSLEPTNEDSADKVGWDESWDAQRLSVLPPSGTKVTLQKLSLLHRASEAGNVCKYTNTQEVVEPQEVTVRT